MGKLGFRDNGSPYVYEEITGTSSAAIGLDLGDSGKLKFVVSLSPNATPGGTPLQMTIDPAANGDITFTPNGSGNVVVGNGNLQVSAGNITIPASNAAGTQGFLITNGLVFLSTLGTGNTFLGQNVANLTLDLTQAQYNTLVGTNTATGITTAATNVSLGAFTLQDLTTGASNIGVGVGALQHIVGGEYNIGIGTSTGNLMTAGSESNNILIGNRGVNSESNAIRIGVSGSSTQQQNACYIAGIYGVTPGGGGLNMATIDSNGQLGSQALPAAGAITELDGNTGNATGATVNVISSTAEGTPLITGDNVSTLTLTFTDGDFNTVLGTSAFATTHTPAVGVANTGLGAGNLNAVTTGSGNTAIGFNAGASLLGGINNSIVGTNAMGASTSASTNTALGISALAALDSGSTNIALGAGAGSNYTTTESDNILIGNNGVLADGNTIRIGTQGSGSGQQDTTFIAGIYGVTPGGGGLNIATIDSNGQLGSQAIPAPYVVQIVSVNNAASPYTVLSTDYYLAVDTSGGAVTLLFPNAPATGRIFAVKDSLGTSAASNITITTVGGVVLIDGSTSFVMNTNYEAVDLIFNGSSYEVY